MHNISSWASFYNTALYGDVQRLWKFLVARVYKLLLVVREKLYPIIEPV